MYGCEHKLSQDKYKKSAAPDDCQVPAVLF